MENKIHILSFKNEKVVVKKQFYSIYEATRVNVGYVLDEININVTLNNEEDIKNLIEFLNYSLPCFKKYRKTNGK